MLHRDWRAVVSPAGCCIRTRRAIRFDPTDALRYE
jgi:hypothetical protein